MKKGLVIRTAFNNQGWAGRCKEPVTKDRRCHKCVDAVFFINEGKPIKEDQDGYCTGDGSGMYKSNQFLRNLEPHWCWEQLLCRKLFWGNPLGQWRWVFIGMPVYFVYGERDRTLTLWGHSTIDRIENDFDEYPLIYFKPFEPLPEKKWVKGLTAEEIYGKLWKMGTYRYLDENHERYLASLVAGEGRRKVAASEPYEEQLTLGLRGDMKEKLVRIAENEGRGVEELLREAVAKMVRERGETR
jgi:hypothetical protein